MIEIDPGVIVHRGTIDIDRGAFPVDLHAELIAGEAEACRRSGDRRSSRDPGILHLRADHAGGVHPGKNFVAVFLAVDQPGVGKLLAAAGNRHHRRAVPFDLDGELLRLQGIAGVEQDRIVPVQLHRGGGGVVAIDIEIRRCQGQGQGNRDVVTALGEIKFDDAEVRAAEEIDIRLDEGLGGILLVGAAIGHGERLQEVAVGDGAADLLVDLHQGGGPHLPVGVDGAGKPAGIGGGVVGYPPGPEFIVTVPLENPIILRIDRGPLTSGAIVGIGPVIAATLAEAVYLGEAAVGEPVVQPVAELVQDHVGVFRVVHPALAPGHLAGGGNVVGIIRAAEAVGIDPHPAGILEGHQVEAEGLVDVAHRLVDVEIDVGRLEFAGIASEVPQAVRAAELAEERRFEVFDIGIGTVEMILPAAEIDVEQGALYDMRQQGVGVVIVVVAELPAGLVDRPGVSQGIGIEHPAGAVGGRLRAVIAGAILHPEDFPGNCIHQNFPIAESIFRRHDGDPVGESVLAAHGIEHGLLRFMIDRSPHPEVGFGDLRCFGNADPLRRGRQRCRRLVAVHHESDPVMAVEVHHQVAAVDRVIPGILLKTHMKAAGGLPGNGMAQDGEIRR